MPSPFSSPDETIIRTKIPVFTPKRVQAITATQAWTPAATDRVFACSIDQGIKINGGSEFQWPAGVPIGIYLPGVTTYTFSITSVLMVM